jgi:hypothetical protein
MKISKLTIFHKNGFINDALKIVKDMGVNTIGITSDSIVKKN